MPRNTSLFPPLTATRFPSIPPMTLRARFGRTTSLFTSSASAVTVASTAISWRKSPTTLAIPAPMFRPSLPASITSRLTPASSAPPSVRSPPRSYASPAKELQRTIYRVLVWQIVKYLRLFRPLEWRNEHKPTAMALWSRGYHRILVRTAGNTGKRLGAWPTCGIPQCAPAFWGGLLSRSNARISMATGCG